MISIARMRNARRNIPRQTPERRRAALSALPGARKAALPDFIAPELATLVDRVPEGDEWLHEIKFDGYRALCRVEKGRAGFFTREGNDWTGRFGALAEAAAALPADQAFLDGEVVVLEKDGSTDFQSLQEALGQNETARLAYFVFDLLHLDGYDLREVPLVERKKILAGLFPAASHPGPIRHSDHVAGQAAAFYGRACEIGLEGIVSKRGDARYRSGRGRDWLKVKCHASQELVIGGFTEPSGSRTGLGALLLGVNGDKGELVYAGRVGTGFNRRLLEDLRARLERIERRTPAFANPPPAPPREGIHWVEPEYAAEVEFTGWTRDGLLRHPSFKGLREDKLARKIKREKPEPAPPAASAGPKTSRSKKSADDAGRAPAAGENGATVAGVKLSHPDRVLYPEQGITKLELARFYENIADWILPHVSDRPLTLVRCPEGYRNCFYQKHIEENLSPAFRPIDIKERNSVGRYVMIDSLAGLITLVQMGVLEIHVWGSRGGRVELPDQMTFDLDPDAGLPWERVVEAAKKLRVKLTGLGFGAFVKTTGGKGLHVVVPLKPRADWDEVKEFTKSVAESLAREEPGRYLANMSKAKRAGKIFIDYLRNGRGATAVAAYSTRARSGAPVSTPIRWEELGAGVGPDSFNVRNLGARLARLRKDPWADFESARRPITAALRKKIQSG